MDKVRLGRRLGIGTRLAAKVLRNQARNMASSGTGPSKSPVAERRPAATRTISPTAKQSTAASKAVASGNAVRTAARGGRGFGRAFWKAFSVAARALWHEVTGLFFAIFALFFAQGAWRFRSAWRTGPQHWYFVGCVVVAALFIYFSASAFVRSRRKSH